MQLKRARELRCRVAATPGVRGSIPRLYRSRILMVITRRSYLWIGNVSPGSVSMLATM